MQMLLPLLRLGRAGLDAVLPPRCIVTGDPVEQQGMLCASAWARLGFISDPLCRQCGYPFAYEDPYFQQENESGSPDASGALCARCLRNPPAYHTARAALRYDEGSRKMILRFKHGDQTHAVRAFIPWLRRAGVSCLEEADLLTPVPLHPWRLLKRRYNQSALIGESLARDLEICWIPDVLIRRRATPPQGHLAPDERIDNVRGAFALNPRFRDRIRGRRIVLIDDVFTTGATVNACAQCLMKGKAARVDVLTLARVVRET